MTVMVSLPCPVWLTAESPETNASVSVWGHFQTGVTEDKDGF